MKICRFNDNRLGLVDGDSIVDVTPALEAIPPMRYPAPLGDQLVVHFATVVARAQQLKASAPRLPLADVTLLPPVANPTKIVNAPINYVKHITESNADPGIKHGRANITHISDWGLFLKATSSLVGFGAEVRLLYPDRRNDHELELAVVIGKQGKNIPEAEARKHVLGYALGLDMTTRGKELLSWRKSADTYAVLGPWLTTADEVADPNALDLVLKVNGEVRQNANTRDLVYNVDKLVSWASEKYTLYPGDVILTGTPEGVGPVQPGDVMHCYIQSVGEGEMRVARQYG
ncbi:MAG: fumarylacetoacetate hydrolase family protein [Burkholderiales bacterium]|nr:fumarylacetoacetate hydrolase family protein [Burkholderiales bacterium]